MKHRHWGVIAFNGLDEVNKVYVDHVKLEVLGAATENDAKRQASKIITRRDFKVIEVKECVICDTMISQSKFLKQETRDEE